MVGILSRYTIPSPPDMPKKTFTNQDVIHYYDQTAVHYRMWWKMDESMGLHYGVWEPDTQSLKEAILNTNRGLIALGNIAAHHQVLDAGCGVGGSAIFLAKTVGCSVKGITLSARQVATATQYAQRDGVSDQVAFEVKDYTKTGYADNSFDIVWAIESMQTASDKSLFYQEAARVLKHGGRIVIADCFKSRPYDVDTEPQMLTMLNGWAMSDLLTMQEIEEVASKHGFKLIQNRDVTTEIRKSVSAIRRAALLGMIGTKLYNLYRKATYFSRIHYKTGLAQYNTYHRGLWTYNLIVLEKQW